MGLNLDAKIPEGPIEKKWETLLYRRVSIDQTRLNRLSGNCLLPLR